MRIVLGLEYNGCQYSGWQKQQHSPSVQANLEYALSKIARHEVAVICAGRTDTAVHATGQVVHFDTLVERESSAWVLGTNSNLPKDISVHWAKVVDDTFHARFSAFQRSYRYIILNRSTRPAILNNQVTWCHRKYLSVDSMQMAGSYLIGEHDFSAFRSAACQSKSPMRNVQKITVTKDNDYIYVDITANAFLHHMVRNIVGMLLDVGSGKKPVEWAQEVLESGDRARNSATSPPMGLYLTEVVYPEDYDIPEHGYLPSFT